MTTPASDLNPTIQHLMNQYPSEERHHTKDKRVYWSTSNPSITIVGFKGSSTAIFLPAKDSITIHGCLAAPYITMIAKNAINFGMNKDGTIQSSPARLCNEEGMLAITTQHFSVGNIELIEPPSIANLACKRLTLSKTKTADEDPASFEIVKSWVMYDDTEVVTVRV